MILSYILFKIAEAKKLKKSNQRKFNLIFKILIVLEIIAYLTLFIVRFIFIVEK